MAVRKRRNDDSPRPICAGGNSFECRSLTDHKAVEKGELKPGQHWRGKEKKCFRCDTYLGCHFCAQRDDELICLNCDSHLNPPGNWGTRKAWRKHGRIIRDPAVIAEAFKIVQLRLNQNVEQVEQDLLFDHLSKVSGYNFAPEKQQTGSKEERFRKSFSSRWKMAIAGGRPELIYPWEVEALNDEDRETLKNCRIRVSGNRGKTDDDWM